MGLDDMLNKAKEKLTSDEKGTDSILDKAANFAKEKLTGHDETIDKIRDTIDDKIGGGGAESPSDTSPSDPTSPSAPDGPTAPDEVPTERPSEPGQVPPTDPGDAPGQAEPGQVRGEGLPGGVDPDVNGVPDTGSGIPGQGSERPADTEGTAGTGQRPGKVPDPTGQHGPTDPNQPPRSPSEGTGGGIGVPPE